MGFFDSFAKAYSGNNNQSSQQRQRRDYDREYKEIIDIYNDEEDNNYRRRGLENTKSNYGWYKCVKCGKSYRKGDMDIDHIIPKSLGGGNERENLQCICKHCNRSKQADTSDTAADLRRRRRELDQQDREDIKFLKEGKKLMREEQKKGRK